MAHVLAKLRGARLAEVKAQLDKDAASHADQGMYLEHLRDPDLNLIEISEYIQK